MSETGLETLAGLQLLVAIGRADGAMTAAQLEIVSLALDAAELPAGVTAAELLSSSSNVDSLISQIVSQDGRNAVFTACLMMVHVDHVCRENQQEILHRMERAWRQGTPPDGASGLVPTGSRAPLRSTGREPSGAGALLGSCDAGATEKPPIGRDRSRPAQA